ncbi:MAG: hypothetical protein FWG34_13305 [Oscillospiraceae bacterium]|nr:hypothetical protein [Oscillospiraceae bacterium]
MKKIKTIIFFLAFAVAAFTACAPGGDDAKDGEENRPKDEFPDEMAESMPKETENDPAYRYTGEQFDFGGESFTVLYPGDWSLYADYYFSEEENGDAVNDAIYRRIADTEEFFGIKFETNNCGTIDKIAPTMEREVKSGLNSFDIALTHCISGLDSIVANNLAYNWAQMPNVDFSKKYWNSSMNEYLTIDGYMPFAANDFIIPDPCFLTFCKDLLKEYALEDPYALVKSGKWTWGKLQEMAKQVSKDIDGDGKFTEDDLYGFAGELDWQFINAMYSCDQRVMAKDSEGRYALDLNTSKTQAIIDMFDDLLYVGNHAYTYEFDARTTKNKYLAFESGRALFYMSVPNYVKELRATEFDFGILPYPKLDESQENYITLNWAGAMCAPINAANPEKVGAVAEYLGAKSSEIVLPAYFDILLNGKVIRDDESRDMLDIIYGDSIYDFGLNFSNFNELLYVLPKLLQAKNTDLASFYEKRETSVQKQYDKIYDAFVSNAESWR